MSVPVDDAAGASRSNIVVGSQSAKKRTKIVFLNPTEITDWENLEDNAEQNLIDASDLLRYEQLLKNKPKIATSVESVTEEIVTAPKKSTRPKSSRNASKKRQTTSSEPWLDDDSDDAGMEDEVDDDEYFKRLEEEKEREEEAEARRKREALDARVAARRAKASYSKHARRTSGPPSSWSRRGSQTSFPMDAASDSEDQSELGDGTPVSSTYTGSRMDYDEERQGLYPHDEEEEELDTVSATPFDMNELPTPPSPPGSTPVSEEGEETVVEPPAKSTSVAANCIIPTDSYTLAMSSVDPIQLLHQAPPLSLPTSATDLVCPSNLLLDAFAVYEILIRYGRLVRLSPFRLEDFLAALIANENSTLLAEIHIAILRCLLREDDAAGTWMHAIDSKDSVSITMHVLDRLTWPHLLASYLASVKATEAAAQAAASSLSSMSMSAAYAAGASGSGPTGGGGADTVLTARLFPPDLIPLDSTYPFVSTRKRLAVLSGLTNLLLATGPVRGDVLRDGLTSHEDHCRVCHQSGNVLCCDGCPAVFHLGCLRPPLSAVPPSSWLCPVCIKQEIPGVTDCLTDAERAGKVHRREPIGTDRAGRVYWYMARRLIVEPVNFAQREPYLPGLIPGVVDLDWMNNCWTDWSKYPEELTELPPFHDEASQSDSDDDDNEAITHVSRQRCHPRRDYAHEPPVYYYSSYEQVLHLRRRLSARWEPWLCHRLDSLLPRLMKEMNTTQELSERGLELFCQTHIDCKRISIASTSASCALRNVFSVLEMESSGSKLGSTETIARRVFCGFDAPPKLFYYPTRLPDELSTGSFDKETMSGTIVVTCDSHTCLTVNHDSINTRIPRNAQIDDPSKRNACTVLSDAQRMTMSSVSSTPDCCKLSPMATLIAYRLSDEGTWRTWCNYYTTGIWYGSSGSATGPPETRRRSRSALTLKSDDQKAVNLILSRAQFMEEKERKRLLGNKFTTSDSAMENWLYLDPPAVCRNLSQLANLLRVPCALMLDDERQLSLFEPHWPASGAQLLDIVRLTMCHVEAQLPLSFYTPAWRCFRDSWLASVLKSTTPAELASSLVILEASIRPLCFQRVWSNGLGHIAFERTTTAQREEDRRVRLSDRTTSSNNSNSQSSTLPLSVIRTKTVRPVRHTIWKLRGEEYRRLGGDGWMWLSATRRPFTAGQCGPKLQKTCAPNRGLQHGIGWGVLPSYLQGQIPTKPPKPNECRGHVLHPITGIPLYLNPRRTSYTLKTEELSRIAKQAAFWESTDAGHVTPKKDMDMEDNVKDSRNDEEEGNVKLDAVMKTEMEQNSLEEKKEDEPAVLNISYYYSRRLHFHLDNLLEKRRAAAEADRRRSAGAEIAVTKIRTELENLEQKRTDLVERLTKLNEDAQEARSAKARAVKAKMIAASGTDGVRGEIQSNKQLISHSMLSLNDGRQIRVMAPAMKRTEFNPYVSPSRRGSRGRQNSRRGRRRRDSIYDGEEEEDIGDGNYRPGANPFEHTQVRRSARRQRAVRRDPDFVVDFDDGDNEDDDDYAGQEADGGDDDDRTRRRRGGGGGRQGSRGNRMVDEGTADMSDDSDGIAFDFPVRQGRRAIPQFDGVGDTDDTDDTEASVTCNSAISGDQCLNETTPVAAVVFTEGLDCLKRPLSEDSQDETPAPAKCIKLMESVAPQPLRSSKQVFQLRPHPHGSLPGPRRLRVIQRVDTVVSGAGIGMARSTAATSTLTSNSAINIKTTVGTVVRPANVVVAGAGDVVEPSTVTRNELPQFTPIVSLPAFATTNTPIDPSALRLVVSPSVAHPVDQVKATIIPISSCAPISIPPGFRVITPGTTMANQLRLVDCNKVTQSMTTSVPSGVTINRLPSGTPVSIGGSNAVRFIFSTTPNLGTGSPMVLTAMPAQSENSSMGAVTATTDTVIGANPSTTVAQPIRCQPAILRRTLASNGPMMLTKPGPDFKYFTIPTQPQSVASLVATHTARQIACGDVALPLPNQPSQTLIDSSDNSSQSRRSMAKAESGPRLIAERRAPLLIAPRVLAPRPNLAGGSIPLQRILQAPVAVPNEALIALTKAVDETAARLQQVEEEAASLRTELSTVDKRLDELRKELSHEVDLCACGNMSSAQPYVLRLSASASQHIAPSRGNVDEVTLPTSLPPVNQYVWPPVEWPEKHKQHRSTSSLFCWNAKNLRMLIRHAGRRELPGYDTEKKRLVHIVWPYPTGKPTLCETWRFRLSQLRLGPQRMATTYATTQHGNDSPAQFGQDLASLALLMRTLWHCIRWDDLYAEPAENEHILDKQGRPCLRELMDYADSGSAKSGEPAYCTRKIVGIQPLDRFWLRANYIVRLTHTRPVSNASNQRSGVGRKAHGVGSRGPYNVRSGRRRSTMWRKSLKSGSPNLTDSSGSSPAPSRNRRRRGPPASSISGEFDGPNDPDYDPTEEGGGRRMRVSQSGRRRRVAAGTDDDDWMPNKDEDWPAPGRVLKSTSRSRGFNETDQMPVHRELRVEEQWMAEEDLRVWEIRTFMDEYLPPDVNYITEDPTHPDNMASMRRTGRLPTPPPPSHDDAAAAAAASVDETDRKRLEQFDYSTTGMQDPRLMHETARFGLDRSSLTRVQRKGDGNFMWAFESGQLAPSSAGAMPVQAEAVSTRRRLYAREPLPGEPALPTEQVLAQKARMRTEQAIRAARASVAARRMRVERALLDQRVRTLRLYFSQRRRLHMALAKSMAQSELLERQATQRTVEEAVESKQQPVEFVRRKRGRPSSMVSSQTRLPLSSVNDEQHLGVPDRSSVLNVPIDRTDSVTSSGDGGSGSGGVGHVTHHPYGSLPSPNWQTGEQDENAPSWKPIPSQQRGGTTTITTPTRRGGRGRGRGSRGMARILNPATSSIPFSPSTGFHTQSPPISQTPNASSPDHPAGNVSSAHSTPSTCPGLGDEYLERILIPDAGILQYDCSPLPPRGTTPGRRRMRRRGTSSSIRGQVSTPMGILPLRASGRGSRGPRGPRRGTTGRGRRRGSTTTTCPTDGSLEQTRAPVRLPIGVFDLPVEGHDGVVTEKVTPPEAPGTLYCVCKTPYDPGCEYLGCDLCQDWFHYACVGLDREATSSLGDSWHCPECRQAANVANEMLYCLCRTPYEPARVYIACDDCDEWYHAECVDLSPEQAANHTGTYICPVCSKTDPHNHCENNDAPDCTSLDPSRPMDHLKMESPSRGSAKSMYETALSEATRSELLSLIQSMKTHKMSWPLVQPPDPVKYPMSVRVEEPKCLTSLYDELLNGVYLTLGDFCFAINRVFADARIIFPRGTPEFHCTDVMEAYFIQQMKQLKTHIRQS